VKPSHGDLRRRLRCWAGLFACALSTLLSSAVVTAETNGLLKQEVYIWQRTWNAAVRDSLARHASSFSRLVALNAEVTWKQKRPQIIRVALDWAALRAAKRPIGLALRIGAYPGPFDSNGEVMALLVEQASSLIAEGQANQLQAGELQIDFDCAESKLDGYRVWVEAIRRKIAPVPVTITVLPTWLHQASLKRLIAGTDGYVLQVHSIERPKDADAPFTLCDPSAARRAVERAGQLGVPFRVALPTYGYVMAFDRDGRWIGLSAEGPSQSWPEGVQLREVRADPVALAHIVQSWTTNRPEALAGIIWYRLPVSEDFLNWRWPTLSAVMTGHTPRESLRAETRRPQPALVEVSLVNDGEADCVALPVVEVRWQNSRLVAGDGLRGFELVEAEPAIAQFRSRHGRDRLSPGERWKIGWLRLDKDVEPRVEIKEP
jgi:Protein of unknown function (DUF3142)